MKTRQAKLVEPRRFEIEETEINVAGYCARCKRARQ